MHTTLESICNELELLVDSVTKAMGSNEPFGIAHNNWSFPGITRDELADIPQGLIDFIEVRGGDNLEANEKLLADYPRRIQQLRTQTAQNIWGSPAAGVPAYILTLDALRKALEAAMGDPKADALAAAKELRELRSKVRAIDARISDLDPKSKKLAEMVVRIEAAHDAADQLPTDLETLKETREQIHGFLRASNSNSSKIDSIRVAVEESQKKIGKISDEAAAVIARCNEAYRSTTSEGLASAFAVRSEKLNTSMWIWVVGLVAALGLGAFFGSHQLSKLSDVINSATATHGGTVWINLFLSLLSIGGPIWFAWIATKQIGQRFRLAEDYGYKASISKAYEGYRREAVLIDPSFQSRLFSSALSRLDEQPLRLVEAETHGSPWHEMANSQLVQQAFGIIPGFANQVNDLARAALATVSKEKPKDASTSSATSTKSEE